MKLLIVDDSRFSQVLMSNLFRQIDPRIEFAFAKNGQEGLIEYKRNKPDFTIIDLLMPIVSGRELIKLIKEFDSRAQIFVVSADVQKSVCEEMLSYGVIKFINKPLNKEKVQMIYDYIKGENHEKR